MALRSMTGYGRAEARSEEAVVVVELSSVNRKQFDAQIGLPRALATLESRILEQVRKSIARGRVNCAIIVRTAGTSRRGKMTVNTKRAKAYLATLRKAARELRLEDDLSAKLLLDLPGVVSYEDIEADCDQIWPPCRRALRAALAQLVKARATEGKALQRDLQTRTRRLGRTLQRIQQRAPKVAEKHRRTLQARIENAGLALDMDDERLVKEVAMFAERADVSEEMTRLDSHLDQTATLLKSDKSVGRELDFLCQEMLREINTIGSKANDAGLQKHVIAFKSELERTREQVQNVE